MDGKDYIIYSLSLMLAAYTFAVVIMLIYFRKWSNKADSEKKAMQDELKKRDDALKRNYEEVERLKSQLQIEQTQKEDALKRLSAIMSSRLRDGNPNVVDLSDQNRPNKLGEQFSELYDNEWTNAYDAIEHFFVMDTKDESEIIRILLNILEQCFTECKAISSDQLEHIQTNVTAITSLITKKHKRLPTDLMHIVKEERKYFAIDEMPELLPILPRLKSNMSAKYQDLNFLDEPPVKAYVQECLKLSWLMVIQDPPMVIVLNPQSDAYNNFREYKTRGKYLNYVVWPALLLEEGGSLVMKGVAEFSSTCLYDNAITETLLIERL